MKRGRKSKYETHVKPFFEEIKAWRQIGLSEEEISNKLNIGYSTLSYYKNKYIEFLEVLSYSKLRLVNNLKKSLWKESLGFEYEETETLIEESYLGTKKKVRKVKKYARSQPQLLMFALCNLCPGEFKRVDKEYVLELEEKVDEARKENIEYTDKKILDAYYMLYPHLKEKSKKENEAKKDKKEENNNDKAK